ncbi:MAG: carboxymuconolactone decarboxylase family protein [Planctomycetia bacterium]|nr:carboxymuconolactone decarboxylase family protein [Planctomycetia bacterium]
MQGQNQESVDAIRRAELTHPSISAAERALLELVKLVTEHAYRCRAEDVDKARQAGWSDPQIAEAIYIAALFAFFNRVADAFGLEDPHYEQMSQPPRPGQKAWEERGEDGR